MASIKGELAAARVYDDFDPDGMGSAHFNRGPDGAWALKLVTGGWSANEEFVADLQDPSSVMGLFWALFWRSSERGGVHNFAGRPGDMLVLGEE